MVRLSLFILILAGLSSLSLANAEEPQTVPTIDFSELKQNGTARVDTIIDALTIMMKDGKIIRLSAIDIPGFVYPEPSEHSLTAKKELEKLLPESTEVVIYQTKKPKVGRENRMGHQLAHLKIKDSEQWVQGYMVEKGLARVAPAPRNPELVDALYKLEDKAREGSTGLWNKDAYPVLPDTQAAEADGTFAVIEGTVMNAASVRNDVYLNFGKDWRKDFTIQIKPDVRKQLVRDGIDPLALNGQRLRVRGWVRDYNGPLIELNHPASLRLLPNGAEQLKDMQQTTTVEQN